MNSTFMPPAADTWQTLQSAEEMEEEERAAQSAKLQELIRRGSPHDLQEANKLMKVMAGYDNRHKTDYRAKAAEEVGKVQQKARILEEMLQNHRSGDDMTSDAWEVRYVPIRHATDRRSNVSRRSLAMLWAVHSRVYRRCARRNPRILRQWRSSSRSMTVFTGHWSDID